MTGGRAPDDVAAASESRQDGPPPGLCASVVALTVLLLAQIFAGSGDLAGMGAPPVATPSTQHRSEEPGTHPHLPRASGPAVMQAASSAPKTAGDVLFLGPVPTVDTSTWYLVPDACIIGALELVDGSPETAVTGPQIARLLRVMEEGTELSQAVAAADEQMVFTAQNVLSADQLAQMDAHRDELLKSSLDVDALTDALGDTADVGPTPTVRERPLRPPTRPLYSAAYMLAGLAYLNDAGSLIAGQGTLLRPLVACVVERRRARTETYRKATEILTQEQATRLAGFLAAMRTGQRPPQGGSRDFIARLVERARTQ